MNISEAVKSQHKFFFSNKTKNIKLRKEKLLKLKKIIQKYETEILNALKLDLGKSYTESYMCEIGMIISEINYAIKNIDKWAKSDRVHTPITQFFAKSKIIYEPFGVVLIISPWNYPFMLSIDPIIGAISAGNTFILKPSEYSVNTTKVLQKIIAETFEIEYGTVICGDKDTTTELLKQKFDYIFFTGNTSVGKIVMKAAAESLTPLTLELGGKSPCIVDKTANVKLAAKRLAWGKFLNAGQTCVAPDYVYVHTDIYDEFVKLTKKYIVKFYGENLLNSNDLPKIITKKHFYRAVNLMENTDIIYGGKYDEDTQKLEPTIILNPDTNSNIMKNEIFAPIMPIIKYTDSDMVIREIKHREQPLALYLFTADRKLKDKVLSQISFGGGCINDTIVHLATPYMPFGGVSSSGMGGYHGKYSFETFSHKKSILERSNLIDINLRYAPFYDKKINILKKLMK